MMWIREKALHSQNLRALHCKRCQGAHGSRQALLQLCTKALRQLSLIIPVTATAAAAAAGHHHSYQRTCPVYRKQCRYNAHGGPAGTVHVVFGHGGADLYNDGFPEKPAWAAVEDRVTHGHIRLHVNGTTFHLEAVSSTGRQGQDTLMGKWQPCIRRGCIAYK